MNLKVKNALISVSNKENLVMLLKTLKKFKNVTVVDNVKALKTSLKKLNK